MLKNIFWSETAKGIYVRVIEMAATVAVITVVSIVVNAGVEKLKEVVCNKNDSTEN